MIAKVGQWDGRGVVGCPCLTILKPAFFKPGDCFIWRQADTPGLAGKWDVVKGLRDGMEKAWLEKDEQYVQGSVEKASKKGFIYSTEEADASMLELEVLHQRNNYGSTDN